MGEWSFLGGLFDSLQAHSPMLGRFWLLLMLVFRILILGTVASDLFEDEQVEFTCNTLQPGCKQVCYDQAFPISQYRFWVFHIVLIATPSLVFLMYATHHHNKRMNRPKFCQISGLDYREELHLRRLYIINVLFRVVAEVGFLVGQWWLYGFKVEAQFPCSRFPCPYTVDCFTSRPAEKTIFLCFYFVVGLISALSSCAELFYSSLKWFCTRQEPYTPDRSCVCQNLHNSKQDEAEAKPDEEAAASVSVPGSAPGSVRLKRGSVRSSASRKTFGVPQKHKSSKYVSTRTLMV
ncbi:gap junction delta-3 protein-like [Mugil cephalus]|uniref:gap junction delta-3 protein-like n=1 Tax=Mugil cephalus TaxID=48193 RepID=UPI001FB59668|nr:gap junction delta-3 protein-like [Mugil cephalus]XP_047464359.1 gap junction delta-3 protein-like [Mugil cephalus]XP_047464360.1 gap junction delta-3 protein-like [Mugil cephalus]